MSNNHKQSIVHTEDRFAALLDAAVDAILVINAQGTIETFNAAAERMFGYRSDEVCDQNISMLMPQPYRREHDGYLHRYIATGERRIIGIGREVSALRKDGTIFPIELSVGEVASRAKPRFVGIIRDISERKETETKMRQQQERLEHVTRLGTLGEMAAGIAHEINQPLTAISTYAQAARRLLEEGRMDKDRLIDVLAKTSAQADRAGQIIRRIRDLARKHPVEQELVDLNVVVADALKLSEVDARHHGAMIRSQLARGLPKAWLNVIQIQQVVLNLVRNAIETGKEPVIIELHTLDSGDDELAIEISDNGPGIPEELLSEIFNPFFTTRTDGTGLGLSISRSIIAAHGGRIEVSNRSGGGAKFRVVLPTAVTTENTVSADSL